MLDPISLVILIGFSILGLAFWHLATQTNGAQASTMAPDPATFLPTPVRRNWPSRPERAPPRNGAPQIPNH